MTETPKPDAQHAAYTDMLPAWIKCRDAKCGQRAIHRGGVKYLPRLTGQSDEEYLAYKLRALFFNATGRTVSGMVGLVFRKETPYQVPKGMEDWVKDITLTGQSLDGFAQELVEDVITVGRGGILADYPPAPDVDQGTALTVGQAQAAGLRPYLVNYKAEDIINWKKSKMGTAWRLSDIWLRDNDTRDGKEIERIRQLTVQNGFYEQVLWEKDDKSIWFETGRVAPLNKGQKLKTIPFWFCGPKELDCEVQNSPIEDLVYVNLSHYLNSADIENGAHVCGQPTPYITGINPEMGTDGKMINKLFIGSNTAWLIPNAEATVGFLQAGSEGFASLENLMDRKEQQMAALGARMLAPEKKAAEAAETAGIRRGGENSVLSSIAGSVAMVIEAALKFMTEWAGFNPEETMFALNRDYLPMPMDSAYLREWVAAFQSGAISEETFFEGLKAGEVVDESLTFEDEKERKADSPPALGLIEDDDDAE